jgi:hypothetical protein
MKALISPIDEIDLPNDKTAYRVLEILNDEDVFEVCEPLYWIDCPSNFDDANDVCFYDKKIIKKPQYIIDENGIPTLEWEGIDTN